MHQIQFSDLDYATLLSFFEWITTKRKCSTTTRNQRLAALMSFSEYAQNRNFDAASVFRSSIIKIPAKKTQQRNRTWFDASEIQILLALPNDHTVVGLRDKVLLCIMYATGARAQEICNLKVANIRFSSNESSIVEAESTLRSCINMIKSELEKMHRAEIEIISKSE